MTQLEALRLADMLENNYPLEPEAEEAAAELRRLHEENEQLRQALKQPEQKPVAWVDITDEGKWSVRFAIPALSLSDGTKFYTTPPKREWVGLTDEEVTQIADSEWEEAFVKLIEAKLKEKNT